MKRVLPLLVLTLSFFSSLAQATDYTFTGNGNWSDPANWTNGKVPNSTFGEETVTIMGNCTYTGSSFIANGPIKIAAGATLTLNGGQFESRMRITVDGTLIIKTLLDLIAFVDVSGTLTNEGSISAPYGGFITVKSGGSFNSSGSILAAITIESGGSFTNTGKLVIPVTIETGGIFNNSGTIGGNVTYTGKVNNSGTLAPGNSPGTIQINGEYVATSSSVHDFEVAGTSTSQFDRLLVNGPVTLDGTLNVTLLNGFTPSTTHDLVIVTGTISGTFSSVNLPSGYSLIYNSNDVTLRFDNTLPVSLVNFKGSIKDGKAVLNWQTSFEQDNLGFDIDHSTDGREWQKVGFVFGKGNSSSLNDYSFEYENLANGINYFRLKQIDRNGRSKYSEILTLTADNGEFIFYPNPAKDFIRFNTPQTGILQIIEVSGRMIFKKRLNNEQTVSLSAIPSGNYVMRIVSERGLSKSQKLLIE